MIRVSASACSGRPCRRQAGAQKPLGHSQADLRQHDRVHEVKLGVALVVVFHVLVVVARGELDLVLREFVGEARQVAGQRSGPCAANRQITSSRDGSADFPRAVAASRGAAAKRKAAINQAWASVLMNRSRGSKNRVSASTSAVSRLGPLSSVSPSRPSRVLSR